MNNKKLFSLLLLSANALALSGCNKDNCLVPTAVLGEAISGNVFVFGDEHLATNTIHEGLKNVTYTNKIFFRNASSEYRIIVDKNNDDALKQASTFRNQAVNLFGFYLPLYDVNEIPFGNNENNIVFGIDAFHEFMPEKAKIKNHGYAIKTVENSIYALAYGSEGLASANRTLMKLLFGYQPLFDLDVYELNGETVNKSSTLYVPDCNIVEVPDIEYRCAGQLMMRNEREAMGLCDFYETYYRVGDGSPHNSLQMFPFSKYGIAHPKWYTDNHKQLCYTAHGDKAEYQALISTVADYCVSNYEIDHNRRNFFIGQMDKFGEDSDADLCSCSECMALKNKFTNPEFPTRNYSSATILKFLNDVSDFLRATYSNDEIRLIFFSYQDSMHAPYDPNHEIHARDNISVMVAPSRASYTHSFYDPMQKDMENDYPAVVRNWGSVVDSTYMYLYQVQFQSVLYPFQAFSSIIDNCRFSHENGATMLYALGDAFNNGLTGFGRFKDYLYAVGSENVNTSYYKAKKFYFDHYYGSAGPIMEKMYDQIVSYLTYLGSVDAGVNSGLITLPAYNNVNYWNKNILQEWYSMVVQALDELAANKKADAKNYETYKSHIEIEGVFPLFALCELFQTQFSSDVFHDYASTLATWCRNHGITYENETSAREKKTLDDTRFKGWGV